MKHISNVTVSSNRNANTRPEFSIRVIDTEGEKWLSSFDGCQDYEIMWIVNGAGVYSIDFQHGRLIDNQVLVIRPGQKRTIVLDHCKEGYLFSFSSTFLQFGELELDMAGQAQLLQHFNEPAHVIAGGEMRKDLCDVANMLLKEFHRLHPFQTELLRRYLNIFLIYLVRQLGDCAPAVRKTRDLELVQQFMKMLNQQYHHKKMVADYAKELSIHPNYLNMVVKKSTGNTAGFHIRQRIILEAKRMAIYSTTSMKEIAYHLGYTDPCHFSRLFRSVAGMNFSTFKSERKVAFTA